MAGTRTITSDLFRLSGAPWRNARVRFRLIEDTYTGSPAAHYPENFLDFSTDAAGHLEATVVSGLSEPYEVTLPDDSKFRIYVPDGGDVTLETLRAQFDGFEPDSPGGLETVVEALISDPAIQALISHDNIDNHGVNNHAAIDAHLAATAAHGATGAVVGTTNTQTLTNKTLGSGTRLALGSDATGDLYYRHSSGILARIPIGTAGQALLVNPSADGFTWGAGGGGGGGGAIQRKKSNVEIIAAMSALDLNGTYFDVTDAGSGRGVISPTSLLTGGNGTGTTTYLSELMFQDGSADSATLVQVGKKSYVRVPYACTITGYSIITDVPATVVLDVWKVASGTTPPTNANSITASAKPTLTADDVVNSTSVGTWTGLSVSAGDLIAWEVESNDAAHVIDFQLHLSRSMPNAYTNEDAIDAVGNAFQDSTSIDFTFTDALDQITAVVKYGGTGGDNGISPLVARWDHLHDALYAAIGHTHSLTSGDITNFAEAVEDVVGALIIDSSTIDATYTDATPSLSLSVINDSSEQKIQVSKSGTLQGTRRQLNFIDGDGISISVADNPGANRVDVTVTNISGGGGGGGALAIDSPAGTDIGNATTLAFPETGFAVVDLGSGTIQVSPNFGTAAGNISQGNHTHLPTDLTGWTEAVQDVIGNSLLAASDSISFTYNDAGGTLTLSTIFGGTGGNAGVALTSARFDHNHDLSGINNALEFIQDAINSTLVMGTGIAKVYDDALGTYTLSADIGTSGTQVAAGNHVHPVATTAITDFVEAAQDAIGAMRVDTTSINLTYNDATPSLSASLNFAGSGGNFGTDGRAARYDHTHPSPTVTSAFEFEFGSLDGLGSVLAATERKSLSVPVGWGACTMTRWRVLTDQTATLNFDIWKDSYANYPPVNADSIIPSGTKPGVTAGIKNEGTSFTGWSAAPQFTGGDVLVIELEANSAAKWALLVLEFTRTLS